ncbi:hypothetical protein [Gordonia lacunae]|uniref:hypothetical protein n=1 Tax=Gordonia lacunae TaxID=417102 RepID=UPI001302B7C7|nr:hypothetical protein [Gordonia lacunae]
MNLPYMITVLAKTAAEHGWPATLRLVLLIAAVRLPPRLIAPAAITWWSQLA